MKREAREQAAADLRGLRSVDTLTAKQIVCLCSLALTRNFCAEVVMVCWLVSVHAAARRTRKRMLIIQFAILVLVHARAIVLAKVCDASEAIL